MDGWKTSLPFRTAYFQVRTVSFRDSSWLIDLVAHGLVSAFKKLNLSGLSGETSCRWFPKDFWIFTPILGEIIKLTHIFEENIRKPPTSNELHPQSSMSCPWKPCRDSKTDYFGFGMAQFFQMLNFQGVFIDSGRRFGRFSPSIIKIGMSIYWDENLLILGRRFLDHPNWHLLGCEIHSWGFCQGPGLGSWLFFGLIWLVDKIYIYIYD